ncbi:hypothetical protein GO493_18170 [Chitinophaga sp. ysch24]|uniref:Uncharacterized protein n=1 Tax=Chitinophaga tropicalis TaxID=2683588 RepID=A0A7K1U763_9BACT|nr:hypothetical protein [Chitinophaga tropicalis]
MVFVSGQIGNGDAGFNEELRQALDNISAILKQAGTSMKKVLNVTVYLQSMQQLEILYKYIALCEILQIISPWEKTQINAS